MCDFDKGTILVLLAASVLIWFVPGIVRYIKRKWAKTGTSDRQMGISRMLVFSVCMLASVWCLRYAVGYYSVLFPEKDVTPLYWWEEVLNSLVHALQTFSMDEGYTEYIRTGKEMMAMTFGSWEGWQVIYGVYASVLNVAAPIAGGAIVLEVLARIFPEIQLRMSFWHIRRKKYFFSELNATSLALAKSIRREKAKQRPILVFTDTYIDDEKEKDYELFLEAKHCGAICVRKDLVHVPKPRLSDREFYLMDENEFGNLRTLQGLMEDRNLPYMGDSCIYLFVRSDAYVQIEKQAKEQLKNKEALLLSKKKPVIVPVLSYRNLVQNLFNDVPLYEPLVNKKDGDSLRLTILGNGLIGTEAFLCAYWMGQMMICRGEGQAETMTPCRLQVNILSRETVEDFWAKIDYVNPDIRKTVAEFQNGKEISNKPYLRVYPDKEEYTPPYCTVTYTQLDVKNDLEQVPDADYYIVALGSDGDNMAVADKLRCSLGKRHIEAYPDKMPDRAVIAYAVFDPNMTETLNREKQICSLGVGQPDIYMHAFGDLEQVYGCDNVYMSKHQIWEKETGTSSELDSIGRSHQQDNIQRVSGKDYENDNYEYWATLARAMHMKYKLFSMGLVTTSVFDQGAEDDHRRQLRKRLQQYRSVTVTGAYQEKKEPKLVLPAEDRELYLQLEKKKHCLAWMEHRRWNAYTRIMGYRYVDVAKMIQKERGRTEQKDMKLKLHTCLVETRLPRLEMGESYVTPPGEAKDHLDLVTAAKQGVSKGQKDYKIYDEYHREFSGFKLEAEIKAMLTDADIPDPEHYCLHTHFWDAFPCDVGDAIHWAIPVDALKRRLERDYVVVKKLSDPDRETAEQEQKRYDGIASICGLGIQYKLKKAVKEYEMKLRSEPFQSIWDGEKTVELRLFDEKRQALQPGDVITFTEQAEEKRTVSVRISRLHIHPDFATLYAKLPKTKLGYGQDEEAKPEDMLAYYSAEKQVQYGVVGIEFTVLERNEVTK